MNDGKGWKQFDDVPFDGLNVGITGISASYIFNHKRFSYPAAFNQSTVQRRSVGSPLAGFGYTRHSIDLDFNRLRQVVEKNVTNDDPYGQKAQLDSGLMFNSVRYTNISLSGGYAYNWVFAHNWLLAASLSLALGYKKSEGDLQKDEKTILRDFSFRNVAFDGTGRLGLVWNDTKWFAGMSAIFHSYNYHKSQFKANTYFGSINIYGGFNFDRKRHH